MSLLSGCYTRTCNKDDAEFYSNFMPKELCESMIGTKVCCKYVEMPENKVFWHMKVDGHEEMNSCCITTQGVPSKVNMPHLGGMVTLCWNKTGPNCYESTCESKMGKWEIKEEFCENGFCATICINGKTTKEMYTRHIEVDGLYKLVKETNLKEFMRKEGMPEELIGKMCDYKCAIKCCDKGIKMREWFGDMTVDFACKFDEELDYQFPMEGVPASKMVLSKTGNGKFTCVVRDASGGVQEWKYQFCGKGVKMCGTSKKTGMTCSMELCKDECPVLGTWGIVSISGVKEIMCALGLPEAEACKFANEYDAKLIVEEKGPMVRWIWKSKLTPMDICCKLGEECEYEDPMLKEMVKSVTTKCGNKMITATTSSHGTWITTCTVGHAFAVMKSHLKGLEGMEMTYIMAREC